MPSTASFLDLLIDALPAMPWDNTQTLLKQQVWPVCDQIFANTISEDQGGVAIKLEVQYEAAESGGFVNPAEVRTPVLGNTKTSGQIPFILDVMDYSITEWEIMANRSKSKITSHIQGVRNAAWLGWCERVEQYFWKLPDTTNNKKPYGLPYWCVPITATQAATMAYARGSHQGVAPAGFGSSVAGINASTYERWKNYNACWPTSGAEVTQESKVRLQKMFRRLNFKSPRFAKDVQTAPFSKLRMFTDETVIMELGKAAQNQNDQLGADVTKYLSNIAVNGIPVDWVPELDTADTANRGGNPLYFVNMDKFHTHYDPMCWQKERKPVTPTYQPDVAIVWVDNKYNWSTDNRQQFGGMISWVAA